MSRLPTAPLIRGETAGISPPVKWPLEDAARALQFVRSKAAEWNIDKTRIGASGGSAGAYSSLWLAFHDDMADPQSSDPIARESTRLLCAGVVGAQTSLDPKQMKEWTPNINYGGTPHRPKPDQRHPLAELRRQASGEDEIRRCRMPVDVSRRAHTRTPGSRRVSTRPLETRMPLDKARRLWNRRTTSGCPAFAGGRAGKSALRGPWTLLHCARMSESPRSLVWVGLLLWFGAATAAGASPRDAGEGDFNHRLALSFSSRLQQVEDRLEEISGELKDLPVLSDMDSLGSHGYHSNFTLESEENWFEITWSSPQTVDGIAVVPTRLTTQSGEMSNYGFPNKLRVEAMKPGEEAPVVIAELADSRLDFRQGEPVFFSIHAADVISIRFIPVDLPHLPGKQVRFFSLSEVMVFHGERNVAPNGKLSANFSIDAEAGWNIQYLTDGQSPLGPPEVPPEPLSLGWHADLVASGDTKTWAAVDLGGERWVDAVRIIAARGDSPVKGPGFGFPVRFGIEVSEDNDASAWRSVWDSGEFPFPNPGYNPVILRFPRRAPAMSGCSSPASNNPIF